MAHIKQTFALWDRRNPDERSPVMFCPKHQNLLNNKRSQLTEIVELAKLWSHLLQYEVLKADDRNRMQLNSTCEEQVDRFIDYLHRNPCWRLHAFLKACRDTKQEHVIQLVGLEPETYNDVQAPHDVPVTSTSTITEGSSSECRMKEGLRMHSESYRRRLLRGNLFDFKHKTSYDAFHITECYIEQDLKLKGGRKIGFKDALKCLGDGPRPQTLLLSGSPGAGKTTFLKAMAVQWSQEHENYMKNPKVNPKPEHTVVVYAPVRDMKRGIWTSIEKNICCDDEEDRRFILQHIKKDRSSAILLDALDEIRDGETLSNMEAFIKERNQCGGPQVLVSARTGLSRMDEIYDRSLELEGYTPDQGLRYIETFFGKCIKQPSANKTGTEGQFQSARKVITERAALQLSEVLSYLKENKENVQAILCNPLRVHILCGLAAEGLLKPDECNTLKPLYLLKRLEEFFLKRETRGKTVSMQEKHAFYRMCLHGLLTGIRSFTSKDLDKFKIPYNSPYMSFFNKRQKVDESANDVTHYSFAHETFFEFFATRCIEVLPDDYKKAVILSVCSENVLQNVRVMICQMLSQYEIKDTLTLATGMIKIMFLCTSSQKLTGSILRGGASTDPKDIKMDIKMNIPGFADLLLQQGGFDDETFSSKVNCIWESVDCQFTLLKDTPREYWAKLLSSHSLSQIRECFNEFSKKQQLDMIKSSIYKLLPLEELSDDQYTCIYPSGPLRWAIIDQSKEDVHVLGICLSDCVEALLKHQTRQPCTPDTTKPETNGIRYLTIKPSNIKVDNPSDMIDSLTAYKDIEIITINLGPFHQPCIDLLDHLVTMGGKCPEIVILYGQVSLEDLHRWWCELGHKYQGRISLEGMQVKLHDRGQNTENYRELWHLPRSSNKFDVIYHRDTFTIKHCKCIPLLDGLTALGGKGPDIVIRVGKISLEDFHRWWSELGHKYQGRITLEELIVYLPADDESRNPLLQWVREAVSEDLAEEMKAGRGFHKDPVHLGDRITLTTIYFLDPSRWDFSF